MNAILKKEKLSDSVLRFRILAPRIAQNKKQDSSLF